MSNERTSDVGVLDKAVLLLDALAKPGAGPFSLAELVVMTGLHRATAHRLLRALQVHGLTQSDQSARWSLGPHLVHLGTRAVEGMGLATAAMPALTSLRDSTGESTQLYVQQGQNRVCVAALESPHGLRTIVNVGAVLPLNLGSAGGVLRGAELKTGGWIASIGEREAGVASVSAPVRDAAGVIRAAVSVSGPIERMTKSPGNLFGSSVVTAAASIAQAIGWSNPLGV